MTYSILTGFFPFAALITGAVLYAVYHWVLRLKCQSRWAQLFIAIAVVLTTISQAVTPARTVETRQAITGKSISLPQASSYPSQEGEQNFLLFEETEGDMKPEIDAGNSLVTASPSISTATNSHVKLGDTVNRLFQDGKSGFGLLYLLGVGIVILHIAFQLIWLLRLRRRYECTRESDVDIYLTDCLQPFSFGRSIFINSEMNATIRHYVLLHEREHVRHHHFLKLCFMQLLTALNWYNPFVWLFFGEMRLQQEMEVDSDVLMRGVDRKTYQLSLLSVCTQEGKWILTRSAFGLKPIKQRIIFMNTTMNKTSMRCRQIVAAVGLMLTFAAVVFVGCQTHERESQHETAGLEKRSHPMEGCWTMDWISNTGSGEEVHPFSMHYGFYNDSTFLCFSYMRKVGVNLYFSMSGEGYTWKGDTLLSADGLPTDYTFPDEHTAISRWHKDSTQNAGVSGPDITEQWSRIVPNADIVTVFRAVSEAKPNPQRKLDGVWMQDNHQGKGDTYFLVNDTIFMYLNINPSTVMQGFRYGGDGVCGTIGEIAELITQPDNDHLLISENAEATWQETFHRINMPPYLQRAFAPALSQ